MLPKLAGLLLATLILTTSAVPALPAAVPAADAGVIEGVVNVRKPPARRTASRYAGAAPMARTIQDIPAVVYLRGPIGSPPDARDEAIMAQEDTTFAPSLVVIPVGSMVRFPNNDPFFHNVFSYSSAGRFDLGRYPKGESKDVRFEEPGVVKVYCEVHESMRAAVLVVENRFWAIPDAEGRFRIEDVPPGQYTLVAWHADRGEKEQEVVVGDGGTARVALDL